MSAPAPSDGSRPTVIAVADAVAAADVAAARIVAAIAAAPRAPRDGTAPHDDGASRVAIALSGGTTPIATYERLAASPVDWAHVDIFPADERCVPHDHPDSNAREIDAALGRGGYALHRLPDSGSPGDRARAYAHDLAGHRLALVLLGLGEDGHTASLFPGHGALDASATTVAVLDAPKPPPERVSLTIPTLAAAGLLILLVTGEGKAGALRRSLEAPDPAAPASLLPRDRLLVIADEPALRVAREAGLVAP